MRIRCALPRAAMVVAALAASETRAAIVHELPIASQADSVTTDTGGGFVSATTTTSVSNVNGHLYLASVTARHGAATSHDVDQVTVTGMGLTWAYVGGSFASACGVRAGVTTTCVLFAIGTGGTSQAVTGRAYGIQNYSSRTVSIVVNRFSGAPATNPIGGVGTSNASSVTVSTAVTTTIANSKVFLAAGSRNGNSISAAGTGYTALVGAAAGNEVGSTADVSIEVSTNPIATPGPQTATATLEGSSDHGAVAVEIKDAVATAVRLDAFGVERVAGAGGGRTLVKWRTGYEQSSLGFNVYREDGGQRVRLTPSMVAGSALGAGAAALGAGRSYAWWDPAEVGGPASYYLEEIDLGGASTWYGPVRGAEGAGAQAAGAGLAAPQSPLLSQVGALSAAGLSRAVSPLRALVKPATDRESQQAMDAQWNAAAGPAVKIVTRQEGWVRIGRPALVAASADAGLLDADPRNFRVLVAGREVPIRVTGESDGRFDADDAVEFFGTPGDTQWSDRRTAFLVAGRAPGLRVQAVGGPAPRAETGTFPMTLERRDHKFFFSGLRNGDATNLFGPALGKDAVEQTIAVHHLSTRPSPGAAETRVEVGLQGVTEVEHVVDVALNGSALGRVVFGGQARGRAAFAVAPGVLREGDNVIRLDARGGDKDVALVEFARLTYPHDTVADGGVLRAAFPAGATLRARGFRDGRVRVFDVTDPGAPVEIGGVEVSAPRPDAGGPTAGDLAFGRRAFSAAFVVPRPAGGDEARSILALDGGATLAPAELRPNAPSRWHAGGGAGGLVIVGPRPLLDAIGPLRALREREGWNVTAIDVEDAYDEFGFGDKSPHAIRALLRHAATHWETPPRAVLLVGDGSYDPRDLLGLGDSDLVPTWIASTRYVETASDDWLVDFDGDLVPNLPIGRLPARSPAEARLMAERIAAHDPSATGPVVLVADADGRVDFAGMSRGVRAVLPASQAVVEIVRGDAGDALARARVLDAFRIGPRLVNYLGHGSNDLWSGDLLTVKAAHTLETEPGRLPLVLAATCFNGAFHDPHAESLAEALMRGERGGAFAVVASTALAEAGDQAAFDRDLVRLIVNEERPLGEALRAAKAASPSPEIRTTYVLFGDPTAALGARSEPPAMLPHTPVPSAPGEPGTGCALAAGRPQAAALLPLLCLALAFGLARRWRRTRR